MTLMTVPAPPPALANRLVASPNFALCHAADGSAYVRGEVEPYPQYWLSELERVLLALFGRKGGAPVAAVSEAALALRQAAAPPSGAAAAERRRIAAAIAGMVEAGVLIVPGGELSRYGRAMARDYLAHRPFPVDMAAHLARAARITAETRVLDLASGPGSLALALAERGAQVTVMELSRGFVAAARGAARRRGLRLDAINESCNRLVQLDGQFDAITVSQALHWLDDVAVCQGVCRTLAAGGSFFVIQAAMDLAPDHPLAPLLGDRTPLGDKRDEPFAEQMRALFRRLALLFGGLDAPGVERHAAPGGPCGEGVMPIMGAGISLFRQPRPIDAGFARAFLSDRHLALLGPDPDAVRRDIAERCAAAGPDRLGAALDWAVLEFRRGAAPFDWAGWTPPAPTRIAYP